MDTKRPSDNTELLYIVISVRQAQVSYPNKGRSGLDFRPLGAMLEKRLHRENHCVLGTREDKRNMVARKLRRLFDALSDRQAIFVVCTLPNSELSSTSFRSFHGCYLLRNESYIRMYVCT